MIGRLLWVLGVAAFVVVFVFAMIDAGQKETECEARAASWCIRHPLLTACQSASALRVCREGDDQGASDPIRATVPGTVGDANRTRNRRETIDGFGRALSRRQAR